MSADKFTVDILISTLSNQLNLISVAESIDLKNEKDLLKLAETLRSTSSNSSLFGPYISSVIAIGASIDAIIIFAHIYLTSNLCFSLSQAGNMSPERNGGGKASSKIVLPACFRVRYPRAQERDPR